MKSLVLAFAVAMSAVGAHASTVQINLDARGWVAADDPIKESQTANFHADEGGVVIGHDPDRTNRSLNQNLAVVSTVTHNGPFTFSGSLIAPEDDDVLGLVFGYQDGQNNFRFSWTGGQDADWEAGRYTDADGVEHGYEGAMLVREQAGTAETLAHDPLSFWTAGIAYDFTLSVSETLLEMEVLKGARSVVHFATAGLFDTAGRVGVFTRSNSALFRNSSGFGLDRDALASFDEFRDIAAVPVPAALPMLLVVMTGLFGFGRARRHRAN